MIPPEISAHRHRRGGKQRPPEGIHPLEQGRVARTGQSDEGHYKAPVVRLWRKMPALVPFSLVAEHKRPGLANRLTPAAVHTPTVREREDELGMIEPFLVGIAMPARAVRKREHMDKRGQRKAARDVHRSPHLSDRELLDVPRLLGGPLHVPSRRGRDLTRGSGWC